VAARVVSFVILKRSLMFRLQLIESESSGSTIRFKIIWQENESLQSGAAANKRLERTRHNGFFIRSSLGEPLKRSVISLLETKPNQANSKLFRFSKV
jgi:hypothetical protein